ncbi:MAG: hypothetical protein KG075_09470 [Alphaproteobacteria bacterium]|nr:hypothetical protein [Alphaproteobacteria bacterium]
MTHTYKNPWWRPGRGMAAEYWCDAKPIEYRSFQIFNRIPGQWDLVKHGCCVTQLGGLAGAKNAADLLISVFGEERVNSDRDLPERAAKTHATYHARFESPAETVARVDGCQC